MTGLQRLDLFEKLEQKNKVNFPSISNISANCEKTIQKAYISSVIFFLEGVFELSFKYMLAIFHFFRVKKRKMKRKRKMARKKAKIWMKMTMKQLEMLRKNPVMMETIIRFPQELGYFFLFICDVAS